MLKKLRGFWLTRRCNIVIAMCSVQLLGLHSQIPHAVAEGALKTREWKTRHQMTGVENAGVDNFRGVFRVPNPL